MQGKLLHPRIVEGRNEFLYWLERAYIVLLTYALLKQLFEAFWTSGVTSEELLDGENYCTFYKKR